MKKLKVLLATALIMLLSGCASVPMASLDQDSKAKDFSRLADKATLFIYRNENFGGVAPMTVSVNGRTLGQTAPYTFYRLNLNPGNYTISSNAENVSTLDLSIEAGTNYYVWQEVKMGLFTPRSLLQQVDETKGRAGVSESKLIKVISDDLTDSNTPNKSPPVTQAVMNDSISKKLRDLQTLRTDGVITEDDYQMKKKQLLEKL